MQSGGIADDDPELRYVPCYDRARSNETMPAQRDAAQNRSVRADRCAPAHERRTILRLAFDIRARIDYVGEHHRRAEEDVVLDRHARVHGNVVLDLHPVADGAARRNHHVLTDVTTLADARRAHDVREVPDARPVADLAGVIDDCSFMHEEAQERYPVELTSRS